MHGAPASCVPWAAYLEDSAYKKNTDPNYTKFAKIFGAFKTLHTLLYIISFILR